MKKLDSTGHPNLVTVPDPDDYMHYIDVLNDAIENLEDWNTHEVPVKKYKGCTACQANKTIRQLNTMVRMIEKVRDKQVID